MTLTILTTNQTIFIIIILCIIVYIIYNQNKTKTNTNTHAINKLEQTKITNIYNNILQAYNIKQTDISNTLNISNTQNIFKVFDSDTPIPVLISENKLFYLFANKHGLYKITIRFNKNKIEYKTEQLRFYNSTKFILSQSGQFIAYKNNDIIWSSKSYDNFKTIKLGNDGKLIFITEVNNKLTENQIYLYQLILDAQNKHYIIYDNDFTEKIKKIII
jgi:hypothetical protein